ncbi:uncharacterized protein LTR77_006637 [Saxophila tyrrhenica]|uniref:Uncharacterized protein n=1 Tax=Saxophila tyrrhenica TaxID=1690608 RepID=A0AAV9P634_9PEZI|nr:hypothetical protein LTR77_006637 [Saxophila tyrrhenica]
MMNQRHDGGIATRPRRGKNEHAATATKNQHGVVVRKPLRVASATKPHHAVIAMIRHHGDGAMNLHRDNGITSRRHGVATMSRLHGDRGMNPMNPRHGGGATSPQVGAVMNPRRVVDVIKRQHAVDVKNSQFPPRRHHQESPRSTRTEYVSPPPKSGIEPEDSPPNSVLAGINEMMTAVNLNSGKPSDVPTPTETQANPWVEWAKTLNDSFDDPLNNSLENESNHACYGHSVKKGSEPQKIRMHCAPDDEEILGKTNLEDSRGNEYILNDFGSFPVGDVPEWALKKWNEWHGDWVVCVDCKLFGLSCSHCYPCKNCKDHGLQCRISKAKPSEYSTSSPHFGIKDEEMHAYTENLILSINPGVHLYIWSFDTDPASLGKCGCNKYGRARSKNQLPEGKVALPQCPHNPQGYSTRYPLSTSLVQHFLMKRMTPEKQHDYTGWLMMANICFGLEDIEPVEEYGTHQRQALMNLKDWERRGNPGDSQPQISLYPLTAGS